MPVDPVFAIAGNGPVDGGNHLEKVYNCTGKSRRMETCWPIPTPASSHKTLLRRIEDGYPMPAYRSSVGTTSSPRQLKRASTAGEKREKVSATVSARILRPLANCGLWPTGRQRSPWPRHGWNESLSYRRPQLRLHNAWEPCCGVGGPSPRKGDFNSAAGDATEDLKLPLR